ncbi:MAG: T9SS type A sorting domain-containing protein, partial [Ignavibacteriae bacterium]|nr:T9SS type A sorting domain-containing protein [Ignavibacteriota bacterium]
DISLKNGYPIITYRGQHSRNWAISIEGNYEDNWITVNLYPVVVRYKTGSSSWSDFKKYESDGQHVNEQPNVEGSKDANGYLINYKSAPSLNKQFVKLDAGGNYRCDPPTFSGVDAKLVRGCYTGLTGGSSYPMLLTLKQNTSNNLLYDVGKQSFVITDQGTVFDYGYDNMDGVIEKNDANYIFSIGPIFASNTTYGFDDSEPPMTIQNAVDFNSNMVSDNFSLSDNDTLIIGAFGSYVSRSLENFQPMKFQVDLISSTTGEHLRVLFRDTVKLEDSVEAEYLRGFIITGIPNGTDSFYVQLSVDTLDGGDGDGYGMGGVYVPDENLGDNNVSFKRRIHFEKGNPIKPVNNIPKEYSLSQNYPNPFNPVTNIKYQIPVNGFVSLKIYDITGREIANLVKEYKQAGNYTVSFNGSNLASSVYFYRIQSGDFMQVKKMVLVK